MSTNSLRFAILSAIVIGLAPFGNPPVSARADQTAPAGTTQVRSGAATTRPPIPKPRVDAPLTAAQRRILERLDLKRHACASDTGDFPIPRVTRHNPMERIPTGAEITFDGTNFIPERIRACIGNRRLTVVSSTTHRLVVRAPAAAVTGPLLVSHGTRESIFPVAESYEVFVVETPVITSIRPASFGQFDPVTVSGKHLQFAQPGYLVPRGTNKAIAVFKLGDCPSQYRTAPSQYFVEALYLAREADGTRLRFVVGRLFSNHPEHGSAPYDPKQIQFESPQPLRLCSNQTGRYDVVGPRVTWLLTTPLSLRSVSGPAWGDHRPRFIIASRPDHVNPITVVGTGLYGAQARVGDRVVLSTGSDNATRTVYVRPDTPSGVVSLTQDGRTVSDRSGPFTIIPGLAFLPGQIPAQGPYRIDIEQTHELRGWDLQPPASVSGLRYEFAVGAPDDFIEQSNVRFEVLSHTESSIRFRAVLVGEVSRNWQIMGPFAGASKLSHYVLCITATYGGVTQELWSHPYTLYLP